MLRADITNDGKMHTIQKEGYWYLFLDAEGHLKNFVMFDSSDFVLKLDVVTFISSCLFMTAKLFSS